MPRLGISLGELDHDTDLVCTQCARDLSSGYPFMMLGDEEGARIYHFCKECFDFLVREFEDQYQLTLISREAEKRESMESMGEVEAARRGEGV